MGATGGEVKVVELCGLGGGTMQIGLHMAI